MRGCLTSSSLPSDSHSASAAQLNNPQGVSWDSGAMAAGRGEGYFVADNGNRVIRLLALPPSKSASATSSASQTRSAPFSSTPTQSPTPSASMLPFRMHLELVAAATTPFDAPPLTSRTQSLTLSATLPPVGLVLTMDRCPDAGSAVDVACGTTLKDASILALPSVATPVGLPLSCSSGGVGDIAGGDVRLIVSASLQVFAFAPSATGQMWCEVGVASGGSSLARASIDFQVRCVQRPVVYATGIRMCKCFRTVRYPWCL